MMKILFFVMNLYFIILEGFNFRKDLIKFKMTDKDSVDKKISRNLENDNYIVIYFNQDCYYGSGFQNIKRDNIDFIINEEYKNNRYTSSQALYIHKGFKIEIHFKIEISDLNFFFGAYYDPNMRYLEFIDFTNFHSILVSNISSIFQGCNSLKYINFLKFDKSVYSNELHP